MSLRERIGAWIAGQPAAPAPGASNDLEPVDSSQITRGSDIWNALVASTYGLPAITEQTALTLSAVYACVNLIAGAIAACPIVIYRRAPNGDLTPDYEDDLNWVLNEQMCPRWSASNGWEFTVQNLLLPGDGILKIQRSRDARPVGLIPTARRRVTIVPESDGGRLVYAVDPDPTVPTLNGQAAKREVLDQDDVLHVAGFGFDGVSGLSPLRYALRMTGAVASAAQEYSARFFANSARPDYALATEQKLGPDVVKDLREQLQERHQGLAKSHLPIVLTGGLKPELLSMNAEEMQLLATRQFQIEEIARVYGVPPFMIGHNEKTTSWGSGVEAMGAAFVRYALRQHLTKIENEINRKLFRTAAKVAKFDTSELEQADTKTLMEAMRIGIGRAGEPGFITTAEARRKIRMPVEPDGALNPGTPANAQPAAQPAQG